MKKEDIESKAKKAIELVRGIEDDFKAAAFSVIFGRMLDHDGGTPHPPQKERAREPAGDGSQGTDIQKKKEEFAGKCGITVTKLDDVLYFADDHIKVVAPLSGSESEKQSIVAKCVLTAYDVVFGRQWVKSLDLSKCLNASKTDQSHLARNLQKDKQSFRLQGDKKGTEYKITEDGKNSAFEIIKKLAKGEPL